MNRKRSFLSGRNGSDALSMASSLLACILLVAALFLEGLSGSILWLLALLSLVYSYFRILSRNIQRRRAENQCFLARIAPLISLHQKRKERRRQKNLYCFFKCPSCGTILRVPKGKGRIRITCKSCQAKFERNT